MKAILLTELRNGFESEDGDASIGNHKSLVREARVSQHPGQLEQTSLPVLIPRRQGSLYHDVYIPSGTSQ